MNKFLTGLVISAGFIAILSLVAFAEDITITTYFPSPYGSYSRLSADQVAIGADYRSNSIPSNGLIVEGQVGIGTTIIGSYNRNGVSVQTELDVAGAIAANDILIKDKSQWLSNASWCTVKSYGPDSGRTTCPSGTSYAWFQPVYGSSNTTTPGTSFTCPCTIAGWVDPDTGLPLPGSPPPDNICPDTTTCGYDIPTSGSFLCCR